MPQAHTRVDDAYHLLRRDILTGRHRPGAKLQVGMLCDRYSISSGVLREVLPRLAGEGLVVAEPHRGVRVAEVSVDDLRHLTETRVLVESAALRQAIEHGDLRFESDLVAAHHAMASMTPYDEDETVREEWLEYHSAFHRALLAGCPNQRLQQVATQFRDLTEVYRCWSTPFGDEPERDIRAEHLAILEATLARDADLAVARLVEHYTRTMAIMVRFGTHTSEVRVGRGST